jgi:hypothetical protein
MEFSIGMLVICKLIVSSSTGDKLLDITGKVKDISSIIKVVDGKNQKTEQLQVSVNANKSMHTVYVSTKACKRKELPKKNIAGKDKKKPKVKKKIVRKEVPEEYIIVPGNYTLKEAIEYIDKNNIKAIPLDDVKKATKLPDGLKKDILNKIGEKTVSKKEDKIVEKKKVYNKEPIIKIVEENKKEVIKKIVEKKKPVIKKDYSKNAKDILNLFDKPKEKTKKVKVVKRKIDAPKISVDKRIRSYKGGLLSEAISIIIGRFNE